MFSRTYTLLLLILLSGGGWVHAKPAVPKEYDLKAAFLYNFTKFVAWPEQRFATADAPMVIGVFGDNPFSAQVLASLRGQKAQGRSLEVRTITSTDSACEVHVLFIPESAEQSSAELIQRLQAHSVLTVGESAAFRDRGGMVTFLIEGDKLRFAIDPEKAGRSGLKISAQLLKLAHKAPTKP